MPPNIIFILFDDLGSNMLDAPQARELGLYYNDKQDQLIKTPQMKSLAENGVFFYRNLASVPVCMPSRYAFLTGIQSGSKWSRIRGNKGTLSSSDSNLHSAGEVTVAMELKRSGYATAMFGKYHFSSDPSKAGFDYALHMFRDPEYELTFPRYFPRSLYEDTGNGNKLTKDFTPNNWNIYDSEDEMNKCHNKGSKCDYAPDIYHNKSINWMEKQIDAGKPFFCYLPFLAPHVSGQSDMPVPHINGKLKYPVGDNRMDTMENYNDENDVYRTYKPSMRALASSITNYADERIGKIKTFLQEKEVEDNTLIIITSDNGATEKISQGSPSFEGDRVFDTAYWANYPYKGKKRHLLLGGSAVPTIAYWPKTIPGNTVIKHPTEMVDLSRTILEIAGVKNINPQFHGINIEDDLKHAKRYDETNTLETNLAKRRFIIREICLNDFGELQKHDGGGKDEKGQSKGCDVMLSFTNNEYGCNGVRVEWTARVKGEYDSKTIKEKQEGFTMSNDIATESYRPFVANASLNLREVNSLDNVFDNCINKAREKVLEHRKIPTDLEINAKKKAYENYDYSVPSAPPTYDSPSTEESVSLTTIVIICCCVIILFAAVQVVRVRRNRSKQTGAKIGRIVYKKIIL